MTPSFLRDYRTSNFYLIVVQPVFYTALRLAQLVDERRIYLIFAALVTCSLLGGLGTLFSATPPQYAPEHSSLYGFDNTAFQRTVYLLFTVSLFVLSLWLGLTRRKLSFPYFQSFRGRHPLLLMTVATGLVLFFALPLFFNFLGNIFEKRSFLMAVGSLAIAYGLLRSTDSVKGIAIISLVTLGVFGYFFVLPFHAYFAVADQTLWGLDHHWTGVIGHGLLAATFGDAFQASLPEYGIYLNRLIEWATANPEFGSFAGTVTVLQIIHVVFAALVFGILVQRFGRSNIPLAMIAFLIILVILAPLMAASGTSIEAPNQSPIRFLFLLIGLIFAPALAGRPLFFWWGAAAVLSAFAVSYNLETGLVLTLGLGFALFVRTLQRGLLVTLSAGVLFAAFFLGCVYLLLVSGSGSGDSDITGLGDLMGLFAEGYGGKKFSWYLPFFVIAGHVFYLFVGHIIHIREKRTYTRFDMQSLTLIGLIVAFLPYVVNRFDAQNLWVPILLYLLLVLPALVSRSAAARFGIIALILVTIAPSMLEQTSRFVKKSKHHWTYKQEEVCLDGVAASEPLCRFVGQKADELRKAVTSEQIKWLSGTPLLLSRLSSIPPSFSNADPFAYARTASTHTAIVEEVLKAAPARILVDRPVPLDPSGIPTQVTDWQQRLLADAGYRIVGQSDYWLFAEKK
ncbi:hypothetical protein [Sneathiella aquimaris]|uniref:hypothetical protein n=1 Tax=Sneathiella aquimaris TaxID=2599305 RepID=UPI00146D5C5B|nr:hypothetical protein [Sneathiella aquimaris]